MVIRKIKSATYENDIGSSPDSRVGTSQPRVRKGEMIKTVGRTSMRSYLSDIAPARY
jgi:hypothetical protein